MRNADAPTVGGRDRGTAYWDRAIETQDAESLSRLQLERLTRQLDRLDAGSEFYKERLQAAGFRPGDLRSLDDVARLPVVTKEELRVEQEAHPPFGRFVVAEPRTWSELHPSTGTTGAPVNTIWSRRDVETIADFTARTMWQMGIRAGDTVQNAFAYGLWVAGMSVHYGAAKLGAFCIPIGAAVTTQRQIDYLRRARSAVLLATPSYGMHIAEVLREQAVEPSSLALRIGAFGGEAGTENDSTRRKLEAGLGIKAYDYYGLAEVGPTFASECEAQCGIHFADDHILVEAVDPDSRRPVADGQLGVLVFTHLTREATPMLRYWSNDYARLDHRPCECGRTHTRAVGGIVGRLDDLVIYKGAKFYPAQVERVVRGFDQLSDEFRIELVRSAAGSSQVAQCTVVAEWAGASAVSGFEDALRRKLRDELGVTVAIRIERYGTLERTTFKAKRIVDVSARGSDESQRPVER